MDPATRDALNLIADALLELDRQSAPEDTGRYRSPIARKRHAAKTHVARIVAQLKELTADR